MIPRYPQTITLWEVTDRDEYNREVFSEPTSIKGRWENSTLFYRDPLTDTQQVSLSVVYLGIDVNMGDYLYLGETTETDPLTLLNARKVKRIDTVPDLSTKNSLRKVYLA